MLGKELHIVFGTGPLGTAVLKELHSQGKRVISVNRKGFADVPNGVEVVKGDATDANNVRLICQGATAVYNCANPPYTEWALKFPPIMNGIIDGIAGTETKIVFADNLYMYGSVSGKIVENLPYRATGHKGCTRAQMSMNLMESHKKGKVRATIGRASNFFGPGVLSSSMGERVFASALLDKPAEVLGNIDVPHTYTFINDFAKSLVTLGENEKALGEVWHIPNAETLTTRQFINLIFKEVGKTPKFRVAPKWFFKILATFDPMIRELQEVMYEFDEPFVVEHSKYEKAFGAKPTSHSEAIAQTLSWYRQRLEQTSKSDL
ncbi:MAG: NAD-dependent epimerase/dehydratase family protein [Gloeotrichia echinulata GP01]